MPYDLRDQPVPIEAVILHFAYELRDTRLQQFATQTRLSEVSGVSQSVLSMIENGLAEGVRLELLARIAAALQVDLLLRRCPHAPEAARSRADGRLRRLHGAERVPGSRRIVPRPDWNDTAY
jgi:transcriptional regulator with XRE-family HTH domain